MRIWVDLATPPQVLFFRPILDEMMRRGCDVCLTARDFSQTVLLAQRADVSFTVIGSHGGNSLVGKGWGILKRAAGLAAFARRRKFDLAVSHNSYAQALAAAVLRVPFVTLMDYEHQPANHVAFRLAQTVIVPEAFPEQSLRRFGIPLHRVQRYAGVKEDLYLADFRPAAGFADKLRLPPDKVIATVRPPATMATYHSFENPLFDDVMDYLLASPDVFIVFLPRVPEQAEAMRDGDLDNVLIPQEAIDGPNLIHQSDLVISGGGTMNREAAVLGTPAYTVFKGRMAAVDRHLITSGRMTLISQPSDTTKIALAKKKPPRECLARRDLLPFVVDAILETAGAQE